MMSSDAPIKRSRLLAYLAVVCIAVLIALFAVNGWFDGDRLSRELSQASRMDIEVRDPGTWIGWPPALKARSLTLRVREDDPNPVLQAQSLRLSPDWRELFGARIQPSHIHIEELIVQHSGRQGDSREDLVPPLRMPREWLASLRGDVTVTLERLRFDDLLLRNIEMVLTRSGREPQRIDTVEGRIRLRLAYEVDSDAVKLRASGRVGGYELGRELIYTGVESKGSGTLAAEIDLRGQGTDTAGFARSIDGHANLILEHSKIRGDWLNNLVINLGDLLAPWSASEEEVFVRCLYAGVSVNDGRATTDKAFLDTREQLVSLQGDFELPGGVLNLLLVPDASLGNIMSMRVPVRISGRVPHVEASAAPVEFIEQGFKQVLVAGVVTGEAFVRLLAGNEVSTDKGCAVLANERSGGAAGAQSRN